MTVSTTATLPARLRAPRVDDGPALSALIRSCPPLDPNSTYAYLLLCRDFADTSVLACDLEGNLVGALTGYRQPRHPEVLFVWQIAVAEHVRGQGLAQAMLNDVLQRPAHADVHFIETSIGPDNLGSQRLFRGLARRQKWPLAISPLFNSDQLEAGHDPEFLHRIGPFDLTTTTL